MGTTWDAVNPPTHPERRGTKNHARAEERNIWKMLLSPTRRAAYSVCPFAIVFQTRTIAMHRASQTRMRPVRSSERPGGVAPGRPPPPIAGETHRGVPVRSHDSFSGSSAGTAGPRGRLAEAA